MTSLAANIELLQRLVQDRYRQFTEEDREKHPAKVFPDFREHEGVRLQTFKRALTTDELSRPIDQSVDPLAREFADWEREQIAGQVGVARCFLASHELPQVLLVAGEVKLRHVFGVQAA